MFTIENQSIKAVINPIGAELTSLVSKETGLDYMWGGDPAFWAKHSPVLFPIVGTLKNSTYFHKGKQYQLPRHGFARERQFAVKKQSDDAVTFLLRDDEASKKVYPFDFEFCIRYVVTGNSLGIGYSVKNPGDEDLYFSFGAHPAFKVPLENGLTFTDYHIQFQKKETSPRWLIAEGGLIKTISQPLLNGDQLDLVKPLFYNDALVFKDLESSIISIKTNKGKHGLTMDFPGFPYMGIWSAKDADFVCLEPWCGIADSVDSNQQLPGKEGINLLQPGEEFSRGFTVTVF